MNEFDFPPELIAFFEDRQKRTLPSRLVGQDGQAFATGLSLLLTEKPQGVFWPSKELHLDNQQATQATLHQFGGLQTVIYRLSVCDCPGSYHLHFDV